MQSLQKSNKVNHQCLKLDEELFCCGNGDDEEIEG